MENSYPLQRTWAIWEMWDQLSRPLDDPTTSQEIGQFNELHSFWQHWNYLQHASPRLLFEDPETKVKMIIDSLNKSIEAVGVFEASIKPSWEDQANRHGSDFFFEISSAEIDSLKSIWDKLVFSLIGESFPYSEEIVGCKVIDKKKCYRFELWCKFDGNVHRATNKSNCIKNYLKELVGDQGVYIASHLNY